MVPCETPSPFDSIQESPYHEKLTVVIDSGLPRLLPSCIPLVSEISLAQELYSLL